MGNVRKVELVNLVVFVFGSYIDYKYLEIEEELIKNFGEIDYISETLDFDKFTYYYTNEMGQKVQGKLVSFKRLIHPGSLVNIKLITNKIEKMCSVDGKRKINFDPGFIHHSQFVLASTKHWANRIYISNGIYAEITLMYIDGKFIPFEHTYPNYKDEKYLEELTKIRNMYLEKRKEYYNK
jgi:hypothetical protein